MNPFIVQEEPKVASLEVLQKELTRNAKLREESLVMRMAQGAVKHLSADETGKQLSEIFQDAELSDSLRLKAGKLLIDLYKMHDEANASQSVTDLKIEDLKASLLESAIEFLKNPDFLRAVILQLVESDIGVRRLILDILDETLIDVTNN